MARRHEEYGRAYADEISRQRGQSVVMTFRPAKCDHNILSLDKSNFAQSLLKGSYHASGFAGRAAANKTNQRHRRLLCPRHEWHTPPRRRAAR